MDEHLNKLATLTAEYARSKGMHCVVLLVERVEDPKKARFNVISLLPPEKAGYLVRQAASGTEPQT